jgi:hypothetical protein
LNDTIFVLAAKKPVVCLDFNDRNRPFKNGQYTYVSWSTYSTVTTLEPGVERSALRFDGDRLEIPLYNNKVSRYSPYPDIPQSPGTNFFIKSFKHYEVSHENSHELCDTSVTYTNVNL